MQPLPLGKAARCRRLGLRSDAPCVKGIPHLLACLLRLSRLDLAALPALAPAMSAPGQSAARHTCCLAPGVTILLALMHCRSRYAAGRLFDPGSNTLAGLAPCHFVAMATPHLGCDAQYSPAQVSGQTPLWGGWWLGPEPCARPRPAVAQLAHRLLALASSPGPYLRRHAANCVGALCPRPLQVPLISWVSAVPAIGGLVGGVVSVRDPDPWHRDLGAAL